MVYKASCKVNGKIVALKKVQIFEMMDAKSRLDCMKEIQLLQVMLIKMLKKAVRSKIYLLFFFSNWITLMS